MHPLLLQTSPTVNPWIAVLTPVMVALGVLLQQLTSYLRARNAREAVTQAQMTAQAALEKASEVAALAHGSNTEIQTSLDTIKVRVNGRMSDALNRIAELEAQVAANAPKDEKK
jgi:hypothetical protein